MKKAQSAKYCLGTIDHVSVNYAYAVLNKNRIEDLLVLAKNLKGACHGDKVKIERLPIRGKENRREGRVVEILERKFATIVGRLDIQGDRIHCLPDYKRLYPLIVPKEMTLSAAQNDKVIVQIIDWSSSEDKLVGKVIKNLGKSGDITTEVAAILEHFALDVSFDPAIEKAVAQLPSQLTPKEIAKRRDFSDVPTFTIDPIDAKDFDDALSIQKMSNGDIEVGIHIADVSYYVQEDTPVDQEAFKRGTSVYLVGQVVPMLPERLSNDLCSLKPREIRPAFSVVVSLNQQAQVKKVWIGETVIFSDKRFTYEEASKIIEEKKGPFSEELLLLYQLSEKLRQRRVKKGAILFESSDVHIELNEKQEPIVIESKKSICTHHLIEEFMLLANRLVAQKMTPHSGKKKKGKPFIYRIHDFPNADKLKIFANFVKHLGYTLDTDERKIAHSLNAILKKSQQEVHAHVVQNLAIRSMEQARYTAQHGKHFGLGFTHYTHFTSPIRRYPDLVVHRLVKNALQENKKTNKAYEKIASHSSARERIAVEAERASINFYQVIFLKQFEGRSFKGVITGMTEWGFYVEIIENKCEGMVRLSDLNDDYYTFDAKSLSVRGQRFKRVFRLGDYLYITVKSCNVQRRTADFVLSSN